MTSGLSDFNRWHRVASEAVLKAAHDENPELLRVVIDAAVRALEYAQNDYQRALALGVIQSSINMRTLSIMRGGSPGTASGDPGA